MTIGLQIWFNENMQIPHLAIDIPSGEITPLVSSLLNIIAQQQQMIESQQERIAKLEQDVTKLQEEAQSLKEQLCSAKKLKGKPKIQPSTLNQKEKKLLTLNSDLVLGSGVKKTRI
ncbi:hypothetical protein QUA89_33330 [Microcoleus sp. F10-B4]|uniref:hypothetical protein n=2 Tax=unclassified Microcoleus TaxID=2642155 RepID=UPI002FD00DD3